MKSLERDVTPWGLVWLGAAILALCALIPIRRGFASKVKARREAALREPGTVELITTTKSYYYDGEITGYCWELTSEMHIRLDNGYTLRGSYWTKLVKWQMRRTRRVYTPDGVEIVRPRQSGDPLPHFDEWFVIGASMPCLFNPATPDVVLVLPFDVRGDRVAEPVSRLRNGGSDYVWFQSAT